MRQQLMQHGHRKLCGASGLISCCPAVLVLPTSGGLYAGVVCLRMTSSSAAMASAVSYTWALQQRQQRGAGSGWLRLAQAPNKDKQQLQEARDNLQAGMPAGVPYTAIATTVNKVTRYGLAGSCQQGTLASSAGLVTHRVVVLP